jgi:hypothetical protein
MSYLSKPSFSHQWNKNHNDCNTRQLGDSVKCIKHTAQCLAPCRLFSTLALQSHALQGRWLLGQQGGGESELAAFSCSFQWSPLLVDSGTCHEHWLYHGVGGGERGRVVEGKAWHWSELNLYKWLFLSAQPQWGCDQASTFDPALFIGADFS